MGPCLPVELAVGRSLRLSLVTAPLHVAEFALLHGVLPAAL